MYLNSAVFTSSFRTWVLFNYSKHDISYTLAPLLVWSQIEMSAGIISACLPTLRPVVTATAAKLGIHMSLMSSYWTKTAATQDAIDYMSNSRDALGQKELRPSLCMRADLTCRSDSSPFYRLQDGADLEDVIFEDTEGERREEGISQSEACLNCTRTLGGYTTRDRTAVMEIRIQRTGDKNAHG